jgi:tetratricopeptide (TPR) repeat protein
MDHLAKGDGLFRDSELNTAIQLRREALLLLGEGSTPESYHALADVMLSRFRHTPTMANLEEAICLYRETLSRLPVSYPDPSLQLNCLGNSLLDRFRLTGSIDNLQEAIYLFHEALRFRPWPHPKRSSSLSNLGNALRHRYRHTGSTSDLEEAIRIVREAFTLRASSHPGRSWTLNLLAGALMDRYHHISQSIADLEEAILLLQQSITLQALPSSHPNRLAPSLEDLGNALMEHYQRKGSRADVERAIDHFDEALRILQTHHPACPRIRFKLVTSLHKLYEKSRNLVHLKNAIFHCEELVSDYPFGHESRVNCMNYLVSLVEVLFDATGEKEDGDYIARLKEDATW